MSAARHQCKRRSVRRRRVSRLTVVQLSAVAVRGAVPLRDPGGHAAEARHHRAKRHTGYGRDGVGKMKAAHLVDSPDRSLAVHGYVAPRV